MDVNWPLWCSFQYFSCCSVRQCPPREPPGRRRTGRSMISLFQSSGLKASFSLLPFPRSPDVSAVRWRVSWPRTDRPSTVLHCSPPALTLPTPTTRRATACRPTVSPNRLSLQQNVPRVRREILGRNAAKFPPKEPVNVAQSKLEGGGSCPRGQRETDSALEPLIYDSRCVICLAKPSVLLRVRACAAAHSV